MQKGINRTTLKWFALVTMFIDHIGAVFVNEFYFINMSWLYTLLRCIGRLSFPIFAFFIAEGWHYTHNKLRYFLTMLAFACISQPFFYLAFNGGYYSFNIFFTFLFSLIIMFLTDKIKNNKSLGILFATFIVTIIVSIYCLSLLNINVDYGVFGVLLPVVFYLFYHLESDWAKPTCFLLAGLLLIAIWLNGFLKSTVINFNSYVGLFAILSLIILLFYNGKKGRRSYKWLFYIFYPVHMFVLYLISLIV